jgi:hypothetical protein
LYGPDFSINPTSGQTFIQIVFNVASDYDENGLMDVSDKIQFYENNDVERAGIKGIVYEVRQVQSSFSRGGFTQLLDCIVVPASLLVTESESTTDNVPAPAQANTGSSSGTSNGVSTVNTRADIRSPRYSSDEEADRAYEQSNNTIGEDYFGGLAATPQPQPQSANDDKNLPPIPAPKTREEAIEVFGANSVTTFGSTGKPLFSAIVPGTITSINELKYKLELNIDED